MPFELKYDNNMVTSSRLYHIWNGMKQRCLNDTSKDYVRYGGRGVGINDEWRYDFSSFYNWAMESGYSDDLTIDRIDVNGNYEPSNCRWADAKTQSNNRRSNHNIEYNGVRMTISGWCDETGLSKDTILGRIELGWDIKDVLELPVNATKKKCVTYDGKEYSLKELSVAFSIPYGCVKYRNKIGMTPYEIINTPVNHGNKLNKKQK